MFASLLAVIIRLRLVNKSHFYAPSFIERKIISPLIVVNDVVIDCKDTKLVSSVEVKS